MRKIFLIFLLCQILVAGVWQDFNGNFELYTPPNSPAIATEIVEEETALDGRAVKITAYKHNGPALFIIEGLSNPEDVDTLTFFCRTDTACEMQIALADERGITAFENIKEYLPDKSIENYWQKASYPLDTTDINIHDIRKIYVQLVPLETITENNSESTSENSEEVTLYLDDIILEKAEVIKPTFQIAYNFDRTTKNIFNDTPTFDAGAVQIEPVTENHYGASGRSLRVRYTAQKNPAEIFFPMTASHKEDYLDITRVSFALRSAKPLTLDFLPETAAMHQSAKYGQPYQGQNFRVTLKQPQWQKIVLPLENGADFYGLRISIPAGTSENVFYLDDLSLN